MAEGTMAPAPAPAQGSEPVPAPAAAPDPTQQSAGGGAGREPQAAPQPELVSISKAELDSYKANDGRFRQIQERGDLDFMQNIQSQGLTAQDVRDTLKHLGQDLPEGVTIKDVLTAIRSPSPAAYQPPGQQAGADDENRPLTIAQYKELQREQAEQSQRQSQQTQEQEATAAAEAAAKQFWADFSKEIKVDGGARARSLRGITRAAEQQAIAEDIQKANPYISPEAALEQASEYIPSKDQLARARTIATNDWKDLTNETISLAADGQAGMPNGTIGGGPGGAQPPPGRAGAMSESQKQQAVMGAIRKATSAQGYVPPAQR